MPVTAFHLSSASAEARANGSTVADFTLPLRPGIQIPATAQPAAYLSSLLFPNELANCTAATQTSTLTMGLGDGNLEWSNGGAARAYWVGFHYTTADGNTTNQVCVPLSTDLSLPAAWQWPGIKTAGATGGLHGLAAGQIIALLNSAVQKALNIAAWHTATGQAADLMPLAGSTSSGLFQLAQPAIDATTPYVSDGVDESGAMNVQVRWGGARATSATLTQLFHDLTARSFRLMDEAEIQAYIATSGPAGYAHNKARSITDVLGIAVDSTAVTYATRTAFSQTIAYPAVAHGWQVGAVADRTITLPDMAASIEDLEKAISREVLKSHKTELWDVVQKQVPHVTLADPDRSEQWVANQSQTTVGTKVYQKLVALSADVPTNRVTLRTAGSLQITNDGGAMMTDLLGFAATQLGAPTEATETIAAANAARIDKNRAVVFHCPSLGGGSYSTAGRMGGSALHMVPITVPLGAVQSWEVSVPIKVDCGIAGSTLAELRCYLATEDGDPVELLGDRWEAVVVLEY
jgi:hypothetical protein